MHRLIAAGPQSSEGATNPICTFHFKLSFCRGQVSFLPSCEFPALRTDGASPYLFCRLTFSWTFLEAVYPEQI